MDKKEAKFVLSAYRPNGKDAGDSQISAALELVNCDPDLKKWFESEVKQDQMITDKLKELRPPSGLRTQILAGMKVVESPPWWRRSSIMALAASLIVVFGLIFSWNRPSYDSEFAEFRASAVSYAAGFISLDYFADDLSTLAGWLKEKDAPAVTDLAGKLESMPGIGCRTMSWHGKTISLICLQGDTVYHVFMVDRDEVSDLPESDEPQFWEMKRRTVVSWKDSERVYIMVTKASADEVRTFL
ncbi:MAG: hypothetical protein DRP71_03760 [Verrucomicrobia bacterium]|nr:MAG: hypothetical protein DRP71_03760 [Verrucomicrobiota bacterium]